MGFRSLRKFRNLLGIYENTSFLDKLPATIVTAAADDDDDDDLVDVAVVVTGRLKDAIVSGLGVF